MSTSIPHDHNHQTVAAHETLDSHGHRHHETGSPGWMARRRFMTQAFAAAGTAAFATMAAACTSDTDSSSSPSASSTEGPMQGGYGGPGGPGGGGGGRPGVSDEFVGVTTDGTVVAELFTIHSTGVSTAGVVSAAQAWLSALSSDQQTSVTFDVDAADYTEDQWRDWTNVDGDRDAGLSLQDMTDDQRAKALAVLAAGMSARGLENADKVRHLNLYGGQLANLSDQFNDELYWMVMMGTPSATEPWGWQFEGHHLVINYFVLGDQVVMTPTFMGSEPTTANYGTSSEYEGTTIFAEELAAGFDLVRSLTTEQQATAIIADTPSDLLAGAYSDNATIPYEGIVADELTADQLAKLWTLVGLYVGNVDDGHAAEKMTEVKAHQGDTHFSWHGGTTDDAAIYYRVQSPVLLIELDCQDLGPIGKALGWDAGFSQRHVHTIVRTPNGNDYGKDLLALHLALDH